MKYYSGKRYGYREIFPEEKWEIEPELKEWFDDFNEVLFEGKLPFPKFLIFSEENKRQDKLKVGGSVELWGDNTPYPDGFPNYKRCYGIYISVEIYLYDKNEARKALLHEMVHIFCKENRKNWDDNSRDFVYYAGWFRAPLGFNLKRKKSEVLAEIAEEKNSLEIHTNGICADDLI